MKNLEKNVCKSKKAQINCLHTHKKNKKTKTNCQKEDVAGKKRLFA